MCRSTNDHDDIQNFFNPYLFLFDVYLQCVCFFGFCFNNVSSNFNLMIRIASFDYFTNLGEEEGMVPWLLAGICARKKCSQVL